MPWRRERLPTPVLWPIEFHGLYIVHGVAESDTTEQLKKKKVLNDWLATIQGGYSRTEARTPGCVFPLLSRGFPSSAPQSLRCFPRVLFIAFHLRNGIFPAISINKDVTVISNCSHHNGELVNSEGIQEEEYLPSGCTQSLPRALKKGSSECENRILALDS